MKLYNTLSKSIELFQLQNNEVTIYVCGITPYDTTHLGHAFTYTSVDILIRYLEYKGYAVRYVQNVTDIDDDILKRAKEVGKDWRVLGNKWTKHYIEDMQSLNVRAPDFLPRATDVIPEIIEWVEGLLNAGVAYASGGNVYFDVNSWPSFGELCSIPRQDMLPIANERGNFPDDPKKTDPLDFVLWQAQAPGEPAWESPWGPGRPGWHIECSTLSTKFLGETIDIHSGGADLCFPHHECEIAQVEPITGKKPFVRFWMHTAMVYHDGEKMSKSLGNLIWVRDLLEKYSADAIRLYLASHHYREEWSFEEGELMEAEEKVRLIRDAVEAESADGPQLEVGWAVERFEQAMEEDLDMVRAVEVVVDLAEEILGSEGERSELQRAQGLLKNFVGVIGLKAEGDLEKLNIEGWRKHLVVFQ